MTLPYRNRREAGVILAALVRGLPARDSVVLGLPRGGVPVAFEVARAIGAPLDVFVVRKLGVPGHEELAMGAIASGGTRVLNDDMVRGLHISPEAIDAAVRRESRRASPPRRPLPRRAPAGRCPGKRTILVDDGLATGASMRAAVAALRALGPSQIVVAVPAAPSIRVRTSAATARPASAPQRLSRFTELAAGTRISRPRATPRSANFSRSPPSEAHP